MKKKLLKIFSSSALCAVLLAGVVLPFSACTPKYDGNGENQISLLGLNAETDEVIYEKNGISIHSHQVAENSEFFVNYITLGEYNGTSINWLILAAGQLGSGDYETEIGQAINAEVNDGDTLWTPDENLGTNQFLVISERVFSFANYTVSGLTKRSDTVSINYNDYFDSTYYSNTVNSFTGSGQSESRKSFADSYYGAWQGRYRQGIVSDYCNNETDFFVGTFSRSSAQFFNDSDNVVSNSLGLSEFLGNAVVKNSYFNPNNYGFVLSKSLIDKYVPSYAIKAYDFKDKYQARQYWCSDPIQFAVTGQYSDSYSSMEYEGSSTYYEFRSYVYPSGVKTGYYTGSIISANGTATGISYKVFATATQNGGYNQIYYNRNYESSYSHIYNYAANGTINFTSEGDTETTAYYRPAMIIDVSQLD